MEHNLCCWEIVAKQAKRDTDLLVAPDGTCRIFVYLILNKKVERQ
jgi:hypothetical protein